MDVNHSRPPQKNVPASPGAGGEGQPTVKDDQATSQVSDAAATQDVSPSSGNDNTRRNTDRNIFTGRTTRLDPAGPPPHELTTELSTSAEAFANTLDQLQLDDPAVVHAMRHGRFRLGIANAQQRARDTADDDKIEENDDKIEENDDDKIKGNNDDKIKGNNDDKIKGNDDKIKGNNDDNSDQVSDAELDTFVTKLDDAQYVLFSQLVAALLNPGSMSDAEFQDIKDKLLSQLSPKDAAKLDAYVNRAVETYQQGGWFGGDIPPNGTGDGSTDLFTGGLLNGLTAAALVALFLKLQILDPNNNPETQAKLRQISSRLRQANITSEKEQNIESAAKIKHALEKARKLKVLAMVISVVMIVATVLLAALTGGAAMALLAVVLIAVSLIISVMVAKFAKHQDLSDPHTWQTTILEGVSWGATAAGFVTGLGAIAIAINAAVANATKEAAKQAAIAAARAAVTEGSKEASKQAAQQAARQAAQAAANSATRAAAQEAAKEACQKALQETIQHATRVAIDTAAERGAAAGIRAGMRAAQAGIQTAVNQVTAAVMQVLVDTGAMEGLTVAQKAIVETAMRQAVHEIIEQAVEYAVKEAVRTATQTAVRQAGQGAAKSAANEAASSAGRHAAKEATRGAVMRGVSRAGGALTRANARMGMQAMQEVAIKQILVLYTLFQTATQLTQAGVELGATQAQLDAEESELEAKTYGTMAEIYQEILDNVGKSIEDIMNARNRCIADVMRMRADIQNIVMQMQSLAMVR